jgi:hypothetical protein
MGKLEYIDYSNEHLAVSMIRWGFVRRLMVFLFYKISKLNMFEFPTFIPVFELAVFYGHSMRKPVVLLYFVDEETAERAWTNVTEAMRNHGLEGATNYVSNIRISLKKEFGRIYPEAM